MTVPSRCATHPSRPAVDTCPTCGQPRCGVDAQGPGCPLCEAAAATRVRPQVPPVQQVLRALVAAALVAAVSAPVCSEYVEAGFLQYVVPLVTGVLCGGAGLAVARNPGRDQIGLVLRGLTSVLAVAGVAYGFHLEGSQGLLEPKAIGIYALAVLGDLGWTQPPKRKVTT